MHVRCPICNLNIQALTPRKREEHCDACLDKPERVVPESNYFTGVPKDIPARIEHSLECSEAPQWTEYARKRMKSEKKSPEITPLGESEADPPRSTLVQPLPTERSPSNFGPLTNAKMSSVSKSPLVKLPSPSEKVERASEALDKGLRYPKKRTMPFYKTIDIGSSKIAVDAFSYGAIPGVNSYFLSHFHSDHYGGLSKGWTHGNIYCSQSTARLVVFKLRVLPQYLKPLDLNRRYTIEGIDVVLMDANHCPGAVVFLFDQKILHTGDFRATDELVRQIGNWTDTLDSVYLDTTYLDPNRSFVPQNTVVRVCSDYCRKFQELPMPTSFFTKTPERRRILAVVGTYTIGKERLAVSIAQQLNKKIWCTAYKKTIMKSLGSPEIDALLCESDHEAQVHLASMNELTVSKLEQSWKRLRKHFTHLIAFIPTGWTWTASATDFTEKSLEAPKSCTKSSGGIIRIVRVPYSEHSSYAELERFCKSIHCKRLIATVPTRRYDILRSWEIR